MLDLKTIVSAIAIAAQIGGVGAVRHEIRSFERAEDACEENPCVAVDLEWPEVTEAGTPAAAAAINRVIEGWMWRDPITDDPGTAAGVFDSLARSRAEFDADFPDYKLGWWIDRLATVVHSVPGVFAVSMSDARMAGGAHGAHFTRYVNFRPGSGALIRLDEVILPGAMSDLTLLAETIFRRDKGIEPKASLNEEGFWFDDDAFALNDNFLLDSDAIQFFYNEYEITAYAFGPTVLVIPYADIDHLIRHDAPIR